MDAYQVTLMTKFCHKNYWCRKNVLSYFFEGGCLVKLHLTLLVIDSFMSQPPQPEAMTVYPWLPYLRCITPGIHSQAERRRLGWLMQPTELR